MLRDSPRAVLETLSTILMIDVHLPLADGRELILPRYTHPEPEHLVVLEQLGWDLPPQPPPRIRSAQLKTGPSNGEKGRPRNVENVVETFSMPRLQFNYLPVYPPHFREISARTDDVCLDRQDSAHQRRSVRRVPRAGADGPHKPLVGDSRRHRRDACSDCQCIAVVGS